MDAQPFLTNLVIREWLNGGLLPLNLSLVLVIGVFLWQTYSEVGSGWAKEKGVASACALFWIFVADAARAGWVWIILRTENRQQSATVVEAAANYAFAVAAFIGLLATLRCIYLFTPVRCGHWGWISAAAVTVIFVLISGLSK